MENKIDFFNSDEIVLGQNQYGEIFTAEIKEGVIRGINSYYLIDREMTYDDNYYVENSGWSSEVTINGKTFKRGDDISENFQHNLSEEVVEILNGNNCYQANGHYCSECGTFHDSEQYYNVSYVILNDCELYCKTCVGADDLIAETPVHSVDDIYGAKDIVGLSPEQFEEVETIFHDCGWGGPATNHRQATLIVDDLLEEHGELYAALTGIGQFQVYVTLYKPKQMAKTA